MTCENVQRQKQNEILIRRTSNDLVAIL